MLLVPGSPHTLGVSRGRGRGCLLGSGSVCRLGGQGLGATTEHWGGGGPSLAVTQLLPEEGAVPGLRRGRAGQ